MYDNLGFIVFCICIIAILVVAARHNLFEDIDDMITSLKIGAHNVEYNFAPDRRIPLFVIDKEYGLRQLHPQFFNRLSRAEWQEFWDIIYGIHPLIEFENEKLPSAQRNYSIAEIQKVLVKRYPEAFSGFSVEQWKFFWKEIKGISDYKLQFSGGDEWMEKQRARADRKLERQVQQDDDSISATIQDVRESIGK